MYSNSSNNNNNNNTMSLLHNGWWPVCDISINVHVEYEFYCRLAAENKRIFNFRLKASVSVAALMYIGS